MNEKKISTEVKLKIKVKIKICFIKSKNECEKNFYSSEIKNKSENESEKMSSK